MTSSLLPEASSSITTTSRSLAPLPGPKCPSLTACYLVVFSVAPHERYWHFAQGILKGEVSLYSWPPIWPVWNQLYDYWQFLFLFAKQTNPNQSNRRSTVQWYFPPLVFPASLIEGWGRVKQWYIFVVVCVSSSFHGETSHISHVA